MLPVKYIPDFLVPELHRTAYHALMEDLDWEQRDAPRKEYWTNTLNRPYTYGRGLGQRTYQPRATHPSIEIITDILEMLLGFRYEGCFLNRYDTACDSLGWHADDDPGIDHSRPIAIVTLGSSRELQYKLMDHDATTKALGLGKPPYSVFLEPGSLALMAAGMQQTHLHSIPKSSAVVFGPRISLTYRSLRV